MFMRPASSVIESFSVSSSTWNDLDFSKLWTTVVPLLWVLDICPLKLAEPILGFDCLFSCANDFLSPTLDVYVIELSFEKISASWTKNEILSTKVKIVFEQWNLLMVIRRSKTSWSSNSYGFFSINHFLFLTVWSKSIINGIIPEVV